MAEGTFIAHVVHEITTACKGDFADVTLVLPSKRPFAFFRKEIARTQQGVVMLPAMVTIHEWMQSACPYKVIGKDEALLMFYRFYLDKEPGTTQTFDRFYTWAQGVLNDFNEADKYLVEPTDLFVNLRNVKEIENWSFNSDELSKGQEEFESLWDKLPEYYHGFNRFLHSQGLCTDGFAYRYMAEQISSHIKNLKPGARIFFAGLNALSRSEEKSIFSVTAAGNGMLFTEGHPGYVNNEIHEAGLFLRRYRHMGAKGFVIYSSPEEVKRNIVIHECAGTTAQAIVAAELLRKTIEKNNSEKVAVVLCDESLLIPFLNEADERPYNVTMGWPLVHSTWFRFLTGFTAWPDQVIQRSNEKRVPLQLIKQTVTHPLFQLVWPITKEALLEIQEYSSYHVSEKKIIQWLGNETWIKNYLLEDKKNAGKNMLPFFSHLLAYYIQRTDGKTASGIEREVIHHLLTVIGNIQSLPGIHELVSSNRFMRQLFIGACRNQPLAFLGEPLEGVQVMGMLETRCLSFDEVIIVSANEGVLPAGAFSNSVIPYDLRIAHGLPGIREKEAVFAYYFYRLIQNCKTAHVLYASGGEALNRLEKSRYLLQMETEGKQVFPGMEMHSSTVVMNTRLSENGFSGFKQSESSSQKTMEWMHRGVSVSALQCFLRCPKDFYYKYVAGMQEPDSPEEWADDAAFGTLVHDALQHLYEPFCGRVLEKEKLLHALKNLDAYIDIAVEKQKAWFDFSTGKNLLSRMAAQNNVQAFVTWEANYVDELKKQGRHIKLVSLEEGVEKQVAFTINGKQETVTLKGRIDRIHELDGKKFIADFKTGSFKQEKDLVVKQEHFNDPQDINPKVMQLLYYEILAGTSPMAFGTGSGLFTLRNPSKGLLLLTSEISGEQLQAATHALLEKILNAIVSPQTEFVHNPDSRYCEFC